MNKLYMPMKGKISKNTKRVKPTKTRRKKRVQLMERHPIRLVSQGYRDWEHVNQFYVWDLYAKNDRVEIELDTTARVAPWRVIWEGALDFEGNKKDLLSRYPEFRQLLEDA